MIELCELQRLQMRRILHSIWPTSFIPEDKVREGLGEVLEGFLMAFTDLQVGQTRRKEVAQDSFIKLSLGRQDQAGDVASGEVEAFMLLD